eukprot:312465_1
MAAYAKCLHELLQRASETHSIHAMRNKPTLTPMLAICDRMKNPETNYKCIHVAGTNGKGSVSTKLAASLSLCGYRVGLLTSPHISSVRERICINGKMISKGDFVNDFHKITQYETHIQYTLTYFELLSAIAFYHFKRIGVDFAVIEVGVGGTWDCTNIIAQPLLSVIVSISLDHTKLLGNTIQAIAKDKCGIIKQGRPAVIGPTVPFDVAEQRAKQMNSGLSQMKDDNNPFDTYDEHNTSLARYALETLNAKYFILPKGLDELSKALTVRPHCRFECIKLNLYELFKVLCQTKNHNDSGLLLTQSDRKWLKQYLSTEVNYTEYKQSLNPIECVLDVAHNPDAFRQLFKSLTKIYSPSQYSYRVVLGINPQKKMRNCCRVISEYADYLHLVSAKDPDHQVNVDTVQRILVEHCKYASDKISVQGNGEVFQEIMYALNACYVHNNSKKEVISMPLESDISTSCSNSSERRSKYKTELLIVTGSFYIMSDTRKSLGLRYDEDAHDLEHYRRYLDRTED